MSGPSLPPAQSLKSPQTGTRQPTARAMGINNAMIEADRQWDAIRNCDIPAAEIEDAIADLMKTLAAATGRRHQLTISKG